MSQTARLRDIFHMDILSDVSISGNLSVTNEINSKKLSISDNAYINSLQSKYDSIEINSKVDLNPGVNLHIWGGCTLFCKEPFGYNERDNVFCPLSNMLVRTYRISFANGNSSCYQQLNDCIFSGYNSKPMHAPLLQMVGNESGKIVYPDYAFTMCEMTGGYVGVTITINGVLNETEFTLSVF